MNYAQKFLRKSVQEATDQAVRDEVTSPESSYIVQAPAGSGKTTLLVSRYLKLLSVVKQPEEILAITFTRKAAFEMKSRILQELSQGESEAAQSALEQSRNRHWDLQLNPQRLKIQTIDSFSYSLVQRMPYESQLSLDYQRVDPSKAVYEDATAQLLGLIYSNDEFADDIARVLALLDNNHNTALRLLTDMLTKRQHWITPIKAIMTVISQSDGIEDAVKKLTQVRESFVESVILAEGPDIPLLLFDECRRCAQAAAETLEYPLCDMTLPSDWRFLANIFVTQQGTIRKTITKIQGFLPKTDQKDLWERTIKVVEKYGAEKAFARLRKLPDKTYPSEHIDVLESLTVVLSALIDQLNSIFRQREIIDFTELSFGAQRALSTDEQPSDLALALDYRISHILIDEYQDTSQAQFDLLDRIMNSWTPDSGNTFFAVGDPMQSIYGFRNADLKLFQDTFSNGLQFVQIEPRKLTSNFRSSATIVNWINDLCKSVFGDEDDSSIGSVAYAESTPTQLDVEGNVEVILCTNDTDASQEAREVAARISQLAVEYPDDSIGMLVGTRTRLPLYFQALREEGLTWRGVEIAPLANVPVVRDLYSLMQAINDDQNRLAWLSFFRSPLCGMNLPDLEILSSFSSGSEMLRCDNLSGLGAQMLHRVRGAFDLLERDRQLTLRSQLERLWFRLGGNHAYVDADIQINAERFLTMLEASTRGEIRMDELWTRIESEYATEEADSADVEIMTIHKAKGLEFDHVILPDLNSTGKSDTKDMIQWKPFEHDLLVALHFNDEQDSLHSWLFEEQKTKRKNELKRLLYVAITRARKTLSLFGTYEKGKLGPRTGSLLSLISPVLNDATVIEGPEVEVVVEPSTSTMLTRLDPEFNFQPQEPKFRVPDSLRISQPQRDSNLAPIGFQRELALGNLVHRELHRIAERQEFSLDFVDNQRTTLWRNRLRAEGVDGSNVAWVMERAHQHLQRVLSDETGLWILAGHHQQAQSEVSYSTWLDESIRNIVVDRTFVDSDGSRWIIDYKTAMIGREEQEELERFVTRRYLDQMLLYASVLQGMEDRPVRCAIYLTDIPRMVELPVNG